MERKKEGRERGSRRERCALDGGRGLHQFGNGE